jgi:ParB/RepB/Spo0J family partition protein
MQKQPQRITKPIPVTSIVPSSFFSRGTSPAEEERLGELVQSIRRTGIVHSPVVRPRKDGKYELICGHRRWRAAKKAGDRQILVDVIDLTDQQGALWLLTENALREDLHVIEQAQLYWRVAELLHKADSKNGGTSPRTILTARQAAALISHHIGKSADTIRKVLGVLPKNPANVELLRQAPVQVDHIRAAQSMARCSSDDNGSPERIEDLWVSWAIEAAREGVTLKALRQKRMQLKNQVLKSQPTFFGAPEYREPTPSFTIPSDPSAHLHRCPACGHAWIGACEPEAKEEPGNPSSDDA